MKVSSEIVIDEDINLMDCYFTLLESCNTIEEISRVMGNALFDGLNITFYSTNNNSYALIIANKYLGKTKLFNKPDIDLKSHIKSQEI